MKYLGSDLRYLVGRVPRAIARGLSTFWRSLPIIARRRLLAALGLIVVALVVLAAIVPNLPCEVPGGDDCPPADDAGELVPAGALLYVHANVDPDSDQYRAAADIASRTPFLTQQLGTALLSNLIGPGGVPSDFETEIRPWFGGEVAVALVPGGARQQQVQLLEVGDTDGAAAYAESIAAGSVAHSEHDGVVLSEDERGLATAIVEDFLAIGRASGVRAVIDAATGSEDSTSLADDSIAREARELLPDQRFAEAYLSREGLRLLSGSNRGPLASFEPFLDTGGSLGAAIALSADSEGLRLSVRSVLDPERVEARPGFFAAFEGFEPELDAELSPDTLAYLGLGDARASVEALVDQATARAPEIASGIVRFVARLRRAADVDLAQQLVPSLGGEAAFAVVPRPRAGRNTGDGDDSEQDPPEILLPGTSATPYLEFLADDVDVERALGALARLQQPLAEALDSELGAPVFETERVGDVEVRVLRLSPTVEFTYAAFDSMLAVASDPAGVRRVVEASDEGLADGDRYRRATDGLPGEPGLIAYLDLAGLIAYGERSGLAEDPAYAIVAPDLRRLETLALTVSASDEELATDARLIVGEPD